MEKISGIIPGSSRVTSVDMKESSPVRAGVPGFGRAEAVTKNDRSAIDAIKTSGEAEKEMAGWKSKDVRHAGIAKDISDKFFAKNKQDVEEPMPAASERGGGQIRESEAARIPVEEMENGEIAAERGISMPVKTQQPPGLYPKGSFVNYVA